MPLLLLSMAVVWYTIWPEILAGRYFGGLLKIRHLAEFTLAVEPILVIAILVMPLLLLSLVVVWYIAM